MARYRKVQIATWTDARFAALSRPAPNGQFLWLHLLTGPRTTAIPGVITAKPAVMAAELEWPLEGFREAFQEVSKLGMAKMDPAGLIWLPNALRHNPPESPNVVRSWATAWPEVPECPLKEEVLRGLKDFAEGLTKGFQEAFAEGFGKASGKAPWTKSRDQDQEQEQEQEYIPDSAAPAGLRLVSPEPPKPTEADFVKAYAHYPRKEGKAKGLKACETRIKTYAQLELLRQAIGNYAKLVKGKDRQYTKHFDTFMGCWEDYLDPAVLADGNASNSRASKPSEIDWRRLNRLGDYEAELTAQGLPIPWANEPDRWAMTEDVCGYPVPPMGPRAKGGRA